MARREMKRLFDTASANVQTTADYNEFFRVCDPIWRSIAAKVMRRGVPGWLTPDDMVQAICLGVWHRLQSYNARRSTFTAFVMWSAFDVAKKTVTHARLGRRPHRGEATALSCFDVLALPDATGATVLDRATDHVTPLDHCTAAEEARFLSYLTDTDEEGEVVLAVVAVGGELPLAVATLQRAGKLAHMTRRNAEKFARNALRKVTERAAV